jgi:pimeloyl-ACP methyl ester carboxylesterase
MAAAAAGDPRNVQVAQSLHRLGLGTLLFDLLQSDEALDRRHVFDIELLGQRMVEAIDCVDRSPALAALPLGLFGASTGAAAALVAAAARPERVYAVVSRGGRPDLAPAALSSVSAPTLLIVGDADTEVLSLNRQALRRLKPGSELVLVAHATHLFEEPGALDKVMALAGDCFDLAQAWPADPGHLRLATPALTQRKAGRGLFPTLAISRRSSPAAMVAPS